jgi:uncharacterized membrane protein YidH (DUF202 family)
MSAAALEHRRAADAIEGSPRDLTYIRTAIPLVSLGIAANRFSLYMVKSLGLDADRQPRLRVTLTSFFAGALSIVWVFLR